MQDTGKTPWAFPHDVQGWLTEEEGRALAELARGRLVLEIGSWHGRSTICMAQTARRVHAVDWGFGDAQAGTAWGTPALLDNLLRHRALGKVVLHVGRSNEAGAVFADRAFDMAFVDGAHDFAAVAQDLTLVLRAVKPGGVLVMHDWDRAGVRKAAAAALGAARCDAGTTIGLLRVARL